MAARTPSESTTGPRVLELEALLAAEQSKLAAERSKLEALTIQHNLLKLAFEDLRLKVALAHHRLVVAQAERIDTTQLEIDLGHRIAELDELNRKLGLDINPVAAPAGEDANGEPPPKHKPGGKPKGRRQLRDLDLPEQRIELADPDLEGKAARIGYEESCKLMWRRAGFTRLVVARAKYRDEGAASVEGTQATEP